MYRFSFQGKLVSGATELTVKANLSRLFGVSESEVEKLFGGGHNFVRDDLNRETALDYFTLFKQAGALGEVVEIKSVIDEEQSGLAALSVEVSPGQEQAKGVLHESSAKQERCKVPSPDQNGSAQENEPKVNSLDDQGTSFTPQSITVSEHKINAGGQTNSRKLNRQKKQSAAARWLRLGGTAVVGALIADNQLQSAQIITRQGLDLGYWPLVLAHIPLIIGCFLLAKEKRLAAPFGALGLLSFAGLSILMLMPEKGARNHKVSLGSVMVTLFSCAVFIYWFGGAVQTSASAQVFYDRLASLREGREEFPSTLRQSSQEVFSLEQAELHELMTEIIGFANNDELRPDQTTDLSGAMMEEMARYISWRQYQSFLYHKKDLPLPKGLDAEYQKGDEQLFSGVLRNITQQSNSRLYEAMLIWTSGPVDETEFHATNKLRKQLNRIFDASRDGWLSQMDGARKPAKSSRFESDTESEIVKPEFKVKELSLPMLDGAELTKYKQHAEYVFNSGPLSGNTLAIGFYAKKNKPRWNQKISYSPAYLVLNNDVPAFYMSRLLSVFRRYNSEPEF